MERLAGKDVSNRFLSREALFHLLGVAAIAWPIMAPMRLVLENGAAFAKFALNGR